MKRSAFAQSGWGDFVNDYGLSALSSDDADGDGESDISESALGGDPTNSASTGNAPTLAFGSGEMVSFSHWQVSHTDPGISYLAEWTDNLVSNDWKSTWLLQTNHPAGNPDYSEVEQKVYGGTNDHLFFRLKVSQP